jgi:hypothetical protein
MDGWLGYELEWHVFDLKFEVDREERMVTMYTVLSVQKQES